MLLLDFQFSDEWNARATGIELNEMPEIDLRYSVALGNLILVVNGIDCSANWGWIPMIDFAVSVHDICRELADKAVASEVFEFTESDATITFERNYEILRIITSYAICSEDVSFTEFCTAVSTFRTKVFQKAVNRFPLLEENAAFRALRDRSK